MIHLTPRLGQVMEGLDDVATRTDGGDVDRVHVVDLHRHEQLVVVLRTIGVELHLRRR